MYGKSKRQSVSELVTRSPIELFWTAKNNDNNKGSKNVYRDNNSNNNNEDINEDNDK